jgi:hypothetical protein
MRRHTCWQQEHNSMSSLTYDEAEASHDHREAAAVLLAGDHAHQRGKRASQEQRAREELQDLVVELQASNNGGANAGGEGRGACMLI